MKKIPSLFYRNYSRDRLVRDEVVHGSEWVINGEGVATRKWDGTACLVRGGRIYKRYDAKRGRVPPTGFEPCQEPDAATDHWPGWIPVAIGGKADQPFRESFHGERDGTYELCGPKINGNPEGFESHVLVPHGLRSIPDCPRDFEGLRQFFERADIEGVVWHHPDGRMVKIKAKDFGLRRNTVEVREGK